MPSIIFSHQILLAISNQKKLDGFKLRNSIKFSSAIYELKRYKLIVQNKNKKFKLTNKGLIKVQRIKWGIAKKRKEASGGVLLVFDIPEEKRKTRDLFRKCLYELGFEKLQKSVFVCKYDVYNEIKELIKNCEVGKYVKCFYIQKK